MIRRKLTTSAPAVQRWQSREEILKAHLDSLSPAELLRVRPDYYSLRFGLAAQRLVGGQKYAPNQPRDDRGRWVDVGSVSAGGQARFLTAARRISPALEAECEEMRRRDEIQCRFVGIRACWAQAALRYGNCLAGLPIPPLNY